MQGWDRGRHGSECSCSQASVQLGTTPCLVATLHAGWEEAGSSFKAASLGCKVAHVGLLVRLDAEVGRSGGREHQERRSRCS